MKHYIGIDLGGTNLRTAKINSEGIIVYENQVNSFAMDGPEVVLANLIEEIKKVPNYMECEGIGLGVPGPVNTKEGIMTMATNLKGFTNFPLIKRIKNEINLPVFMDNDANVAGLAEAIHGAGKGKDIVFYVTHSTGIGGALIVDGKLVSGRKGYAGEIGNIIVKTTSESFNGLNPGAVEGEASGPAIARKAKERISNAIRGAEEVFYLATEGNKEAQKIIDEVAYDFAVALSTIAHVVDPYCFVIGGGISKSHELYFERVRKYFKSLVHPGMRDIEILKSKLKEPGLIGAAMLPVSNGY